MNRALAQSSAFVFHRLLDEPRTPNSYASAAQGGGAVSDATIRPSVCLSVCLSVCPMALTQERCILG